MVIGMIVSALMESQEIREQLVALLSQDRLGVELDALDSELAVAHAHDLAVIALCGDLEAGRNARALDHQ
jgi:hypothetical protein